MKYKKMKKYYNRSFKKRKKHFKKHAIAKVNLKSPVLDILPEQKQKRKRKQGKVSESKIYFNQKTEDAIVSYNKEENMDIREQIFREKILFPFQKLIENVHNTFKFSYFETGPRDVQNEVLSHLVANMHKYKKAKGKAFSYFSIVAKHYLIHLNNTNYKKFNQNMEISDEKDENTIQLQHTDKYYANKEMTDFIKLVVDFWDTNAGKVFTKQRDLDIANAVVELFRNSHRITQFNKKALYLYIREMSSCRTQQITKILNKMKLYYDKMRYSYQNNGTVNTKLLS